MKRPTLLLLALVLGAPPHQAGAQASQPPTASEAGAETADSIIRRLTRQSVALVDGAGKVLATRQRSGEPVEPLSEQTIVETLGRASVTGDQAAALWSFFADGDNAALVTLPIVRALAAASDTPTAREALWSELAGIAREHPAKPGRNVQDRALLSLVERHRSEILPRLIVLGETEGAGDEMVDLMLASRVFGDDLDESLAEMLARNPGAVARRIERERENGRPVRWEHAAFDGMMRWKAAHLVAGAPAAPRSLAALDAAGETFVTIFNSLHALDDWYREQMLRGLGPVELFNAAVGGERELYRLGTSGYRGFLHPVIMRGIKESKSFEAFLERASSRLPGEDAVRSSWRRGMVFVRIASSFGLLDSVLETVHDRERFIADAIASLGDPRSFEGSTSIVVDLLTGRSPSPRALAFRRALLDRLYDSYREGADAARRSVYGAMLSAYQTVTGDRRDSEIDRAFPLDPAMLRLPFERLFAADGRGGLVHRIFMRMDEDVDAVRTHASFRVLMATLGASARDERHFTQFRLAARRRTIEIYVNKPNAAGVRQGIDDIAKALRGARVHTVVGRGHTGIITPLQKDARRVLGDGVRNVAMVIVGTCGGDASVRELIATFGYLPFVTTKSTGRQIINNAIIETYVAALRAIGPGDQLSMPHVVDKALARFLRPRGDEELREDARLYHVNLATALAARLFDTHVRRHTQPEMITSRR